MNESVLNLICISGYNKKDGINYPITVHISGSIKGQTLCNRNLIKIGYEQWEGTKEKVTCKDCLRELG